MQEAFYDVMYQASIKGVHIGRARLCLDAWSYTLIYTSHILELSNTSCVKYAKQEMHVGSRKKVEIR